MRGAVHALLFEAAALAAVALIVLGLNLGGAARAVALWAGAL